ncbi:hypothetical protein [Ancylobacter sp. FA202]|uniref:hypothetical protein n=1 Tax=Ancylobacter sp. FA202 TaxID=1111106 RepID=UPI00036AE1A3|nr:hypothetical protein [Ancylobacter sp. FA202]
MAARITPTQRKILINASEGRPLDHGRPTSRSTVGYWNCAVRSCRRKGWLDQRTDQLTEKGRRVLDMTPPAASVRLTTSQYRVLLYMVQNNAKLIRGKGASARTDDSFKWPVPASTVDHLIKERLIEREERETEHELLAVSVLGFGTVKEKLRRAAAAQERAARLAGDAPTPLEQLIWRTLTHG